MNDDPADARALARRRLQLSRELEQTRQALPHPSIGGARGYPLWFRQEELQRHQTGNPTTASPSSLTRWGIRLEPYRMTGNAERSELVGIDLILLAIVFTIYPQATLDEMAMFIYNEGGGIYERKQISRRLDELCVTSKKSSIEAYQAFTPHHLLREHLFWTHPLPLGVVGIPRFKLIDVDEFGLELKQLNRSKGWGFSFYRVRNVGNYTKETKLTVTFAIEAGDPAVPNNLQGSVARPRRWINVRRVSGTTAENYAQDCDAICNSIETGFIPGTDEHRVIMHDNLRAHLTPIVYQTVEARNGPTHFNILQRPAYQPKYGPIEYKICDIIQHMKYQRPPQRMSLDEMEAAIYEAAAQVGPFDSTFAHCGYSVDGTY